MSCSPEAYILSTNEAGFLSGVHSSYGTTDDDEDTTRPEEEGNPRNTAFPVRREGIENKRRRYTQTKK